ncbi:MAG: glycosyl hydrolase [Hyphomicrobiales bacterium]|nr:MAG: glycosyl hydrolase [Hyphomicrobiales bacterium]
MPSDTITRDVPLWESHAWFFDLYAALLDDPKAARASIAERLRGAGDTLEAGLALFLAGTLSDISGDASLVRAADAAISRVADALRREMRPTNNAFSDTWQVALWAGALRLANQVLQRPDLTQLVAPAKNHVYAHHTGGSTLMSSSDRTTLGFDALLTAVPFGLFDAEDLILVDAARRLAERSDATPGERQMLAWYYGEQGSYGRSRDLLAGDSVVSKIVRKRLKRMGQLDKRFVRHLPDGNGNRYEPLLEERFPKLITAEDEVLVRAIALPHSEDEPLDCIVDGEVIAGRFEATHWEFVLPARMAGATPRYRLRFRHHSETTSPEFSYEVLARKHGGQLAVDGNRIAVVAGTETDLDPLELNGVRFSDVSWIEDATGKVREISLRLRHAPAGIYGLGERYNALNQAGNRVDQFVYNQYKNQGLRTYIPMPVFYTDQGFGLHLATDSYSWFDFREPGVTLLGVEAGDLQLDFLTGSVNEQVAQFLASTGDPVNVPLWALGPWMSSNNWDNQAEIEKQVALTEEHGIPATVLVIEAWSDEATFYIWNDATYAGKPGSDAFTYGDFTFPEWGRWPDPKGMVEHLHEHGLKLILWQIPVIKQTAALRHAQKQRDEQHFLAQNYGVRHPNGEALRLPEGWFKDSLLMDFTHREGVDWWLGKRQYLIDDLGVDGFKTDGGEMVWGRDLVFADGTDGLLNRNRYPRDYIAAYYRFAQQNGGICFSRAGYTGAQTFPAHWAGDERSTWDAFKRSLLAGLSAGMSGVIFWGWDFAGFSGEVPSAELYLRGAQMACFCPIMQYHAESKAELNQDRTPWNIAERSGDPRALTGYAFYANLRMQLLPYLEQEAAHCVAAKTPLMRAMLLDHQGDATASKLWDQYMLGRDLLVAPVIEEGVFSRDVYLPAGRWWHLFEQRWYEGGRSHHIAAPLASIPVFLRDGAVLPLGFDGEIRLGATMRSGINAPRHRVNLRAGEPLAQAVPITQH